MFGYTEEEILGKSVTILMPEEYRGKHISGLKRYLETGSPKIIGKIYETEGLTKDGKRIPIELSLSEERLGKDRFFVGIIRDITERKRTERALRESEEKFKSLAEKSPNMIFINKKGRIVYANEKCEEIMGYKREEFYSPNFDFLTLIAPESRDLVKSNFKRHMEDEEIPPYEYTLVTKNGKRIVGIHTTRLINYEGERAILGIVTDITERKENEQRIKEYTEQLERSNMMKDLFIDILRHDLLNPIGMIKNAAELMREEGERKELDIIMNNAQKAIDLIISASQLGRLEGMERLDKEVMDLAEVLKGVIDDFSEDMRQRKQRIIYDGKMGLEAEVNPLIGDVFANLLSNAIKYSPEKSTIKLNVEDEDGSLKIMVKDQCSGIKDEDKERIFTRFHRVKKEGVRGIGLGLAITKRIVELHDGEIWVDDNPEGGCTFYVRLPKKQVNN